MKNFFVFLLFLSSANVRANVWEKNYLLSCETDYQGSPRQGMLKGVVSFGEKASGKDGKYSNAKFKGSVGVVFKATNQSYSDENAVLKGWLTRGDNSDGDRNEISISDGKVKFEGVLNSSTAGGEIRVKGVYELQADLHCKLQQI